MNLEVLISCMHQQTTGIASKSAIQCDALIINQCNENNYVEESHNGFKVRMISTIERGLSRSRNMAIENSNGDICLVCDDDEILHNGYAEKIIKAFEDNPQADVITFIVKNSEKKYPASKYRINYITALKQISYQIAFRRSVIFDKNIKFDITVGSGVSKAGGEENLFLYSCLKNKLKLYYVPIVIGHIVPGESQWWHGYNAGYFFDRGIFTRKLMGRFWAFFYAVEFIIMKYPKYKSDISPFPAFYQLMKGIWA